MVLHELTGLSPHDIALGQRLAGTGFTVYMPLLFGELAQDRFVAGYFQSCINGEFVCSTPSTTSPAVESVKVLCEAIGRRTPGPMGVVGMCLTGAFPLALLSDKVQAAVICQPTVPFGLFAAVAGLTDRESQDLGLSPKHIDHAKDVDVPLLALRYAKDWRCPRKRLQTLAATFENRVAIIDIATDRHPVGRHHSTLAADCDRDAFADAVTYLHARLGLAREARDMRLATFEDKPCRMTANRRWQVRRWARGELASDGHGPRAS